MLATTVDTVMGKCLKIQVLDETLKQTHWIFYQRILYQMKHMKQPFPTYFKTFHKALSIKKLNQSYKNL